MAQKPNKPLTAQQERLLLNTTARNFASIFPDHSQAWLAKRRQQLVRDLPPSLLLSHARETSHVRAQKLEAERLYAGAERELEALRQEVTRYREILDNAHDARPVRIEAAPKAKHEATAVVQASDWHAEEIVEKEKVNGLNTYNLDEYAKRKDKYFANTLKLLEGLRHGVAIKNLVWWLGGDFCTGNIHEENAENCSLPPVAAHMLVEADLAGGLQYWLDNSDYQITIVCNVGNHSRITDRVYSQTEAENSLETFMYYALGIRFSGNPRVRVSMPQGPHQYADIHGVTCRFCHGHDIRHQGGTHGVMCSVNTMCKKWESAKHANVTFFGHHHQLLPGQWAKGNGSLIGYNAYALRHGFGFEPPTQLLSLIDSRYGPTISAPIVVT